MSLHGGRGMLSRAVRSSHIGENTLGGFFISLCSAITRGWSKSAGDLGTRGAMPEVWGHDSVSVEKTSDEGGDGAA